jgi:predicted Zn-dependent protease
MNAQEQTFLELLAFVYLENAQAHKARILLEALLSVESATPARRNALAWACLQLNLPKEALQTLEGAETGLEVSVADRRAGAYLRGQAFLRLGRATEAQAALAEFTRSPS